MVQYRTHASKSSYGNNVEFDCCLDMVGDFGPRLKGGVSAYSSRAVVRISVHNVSGLSPHFYVMRIQLCHVKALQGLVH